MRSQENYTYRGGAELKRATLVLVLFFVAGLVWAQESPPIPAVKVTDTESGRVIESGPPIEEPPLVEVKPAVAAKPPLTILFRGKEYVLPEDVPARLLSFATSEKEREKLRKTWQEFRAHVRAGGDWSLVSYYYRRGEIFQTVADSQGLYVVDRSLASGPKGERYTALDSHPKAPHGHLGIFKVGLGHASRDVDHWSSKWKCPMDYSLFYCNGHAIHSALAEAIPFLGDPASHGCTRNHPAAARRRFARVGEKKYFVLVTDDKMVGEVFGLRRR
jgi:hypothetical protein